jgi:prepilin-type processing-associated H-X9-DG protein
MIAADARLSRYNPLPRILTYDDFSEGPSGWAELLGNYDGNGDLDTVDDHMRDFRPAQISGLNFFDIGSHGAMSGNYALKLATRAHPGHTANAIRRLTMAGKGRVQLETYFTYKPEANLGADPDNNTLGDLEWDANVHPAEADFGSITFGTDMCNDGLRYHCVVRYENTDLDQKLTRVWKVPTIPEPTPREHFEGKYDLKYGADFYAPDPDQWLTFAGPQELCFNEVPTKVNWHYLRWVFDTEERRNIEIQLNDQTMDMRDLPVPPYEDSYDSLETLLNFSFGVRTHSGRRNFLFLDSVLISVDW